MAGAGKTTVRSINSGRILIGIIHPAGGLITRGRKQIGRIPNGKVFPSRSNARRMAAVAGKVRIRLMRNRRRRINRSCNLIQALLNRHGVLTPRISERRAVRMNELPPAIRVSHRMAARVVTSPEVRVSHRPRAGAHTKGVVVLGVPGSENV